MGKEAPGGIDGGGTEVCILCADKSARREFVSRKVSPSEVRASRRVRRLLRTRTQRMLQQISRVRRRASADAVHDLRVATRRLHEALVFFKPDLPARPR